MGLAQHLHFPCLMPPTLGQQLYFPTAPPTSLPLPLPQPRSGALASTRAALFLLLVAWQPAEMSDEPLLVLLQSTHPARSRALPSVCSLQLSSVFPLVTQGFSHTP